MTAQNPEGKKRTASHYETRRQGTFSYLPLDHVVKACGDKNVFILISVLFFSFSHYISQSLFQLFLHHSFFFFRYINIFSLFSLFFFVISLCSFIFRCFILWCSLFCGLIFSFTSFRFFHYFSSFIIFVVSFFLSLFHSLLIDTILLFSFAISIFSFISRFFFIFLNNFRSFLVFHLFFVDFLS